MRSTMTLLAAACWIACSPVARETIAGSTLGEDDDPAAAGAEWGLLVYAANDDLNEELVRGFAADAEEWARFVGGSRMFRVLVQRDRSRHDESPTTERYLLERGQKLDPRTLEPGVQDLGETDTTRPGPLREFLKFGIEHLRAERYWLVVTGHGDNWLGLATDASSGSGARLPLADLRTELEAVVSGELRTLRAGGRAGSDRLDVIQFDACRMGSMEVATELQGVADFLVGSQENEPNAGHPYGAFYSLAQLHLGSSPRTAVAEVVSDYVRSYNEHLSTRPGKYVGTGITSVALDLRKLGRLVDDLGALVEAVRRQRAQGLSCSELATVRATLGEPGTGDTRPVAAEAAVDLLALLHSIETSALFSEEVQRSARRAIDTIGRPDERYDPNRRFGFVRASPESMPEHSPYVTEGHSLDARPESEREPGAGPRPHGLSIMLGDPRRLLSSADGPPAMGIYRATAFERATQWTTLVEACEARRQACIDWTGSPFAPDNPCRD